jgi:hypothetical protein
MRSTGKILLAAMFLIPLIYCGTVFGADDGDAVPDVTARVARISLLEGEAKVKHSDLDDWESASQNLPVVEGDEIATEGGARLEIQFDSVNYVRLAEDSRLRVVTLQDGGIVLSLTQGNLSLRILEFDKARSFFEIDAPATTIAIEKAGRFRIDAGYSNATEMRVSVGEGGEAHVYSETSGFPLRSGRSATVQLTGEFAGDWESADAAPLADEFDGWSAERDRLIADRLKDSYYDKYYDRDVYGAEDLAGFGEWTYLDNYGYVWRPFPSSVSRYQDWSPYRYGQWRWVPPFGWTWVNDEPWGWATYHHGRWFYENGYWYWSPYGYYRPKRSWWTPALVVISTVNDNVCWYPLPYNRRYHNYNRDHRGGRGDRPGGRPTPTPAPSPTTAGNRNEERRRRLHTPPLQRVPPAGVVTARAEDFGSGRRRFNTPPVDIARTVLTRTADTEPDLAVLPNRRIPASGDRRNAPAQPPADSPAPAVRTGAADRTARTPMDNELRRMRIYGNRPPRTAEPENPASTTGTGQGETGVSRQPETRRTERPRTERPNPRSETPVTEAPAVEPVKKEKYRQEGPPRTEDPRRSTPRTESPRQEPPRSEAPRREAPRVETPRQETPRAETPRQESPRSESPKREEPKQESPKRDDPPPRRSEPADDPKPNRPSISDRKKDG